LFLLVSTVTFALACASSTKWRLLSVSALVLFIGLALVTGSHSHERISAGIENFKNATTSENNTSLGIRRVMWTNTIKIISQYPLMGTGSGSFADAYAETVKDQTGWRAQNTDDPHQQYLHIWAEHGIIGLFIFLLLISAMASASKNRILLALSLSLLAGTALNSLFNGHFSAFVEGRLFWILSSAIAASSPSFLSPVYEYLIRKI
jgi:O-antigen ligase